MKSCLVGPEVCQDPTMTSLEAVLPGVRNRLSNLEHVADQSNRGIARLQEGLEGVVDCVGALKTQNQASEARLIRGLEVAIDTMKGDRSQAGLVGNILEDPEELVVPPQASHYTLHACHHSIQSILDEYYGHGLFEGRIPGGIQALEAKGKAWRRGMRGASQHLCRIRSIILAVDQMSIEDIEMQFADCRKSISALVSRLKNTGVLLKGRPRGRVVANEV